MVCVSHGLGYLSLNTIVGELGLGPDEPKSATKPAKHPLLGGIEVLQ